MKRLQEQGITETSGFGIPKHFNISLGRAEVHWGAQWGLIADPGATEPGMDVMAWMNQEYWTSVGVMGRSEPVSSPNFTRKLCFNHTHVT